ncbi:hypothetical protein ACFFMN_05790 [Planobispora siamensis]|uniref:Uncharacterized protein n=1 Tax=Planobispora siamensis TaxID=936338 RepID=A0A8J3SJN5_9ACTN|nr:hypothetical protein [Planobispora siamensis]GIH94305.1 hypothetical protein Psi01_49350 [Planobispora siamensis]
MVALTSPRSLDPAAPGRRRRLALTAAGPVFLLLIPLASIGLYGGHLPDHGPGQGWSAGNAVVMVVYFEAILLITFLRYRHLPRVQQALVAAAFFLGLSVPVTETLSMLAAASGAATRPGWHLAVEIAVSVAAPALGWALAGPLPPSPEATAAPPPHAPAMVLSPGQRAVFTASAWSMRRLTAAVAIAAVTAYVTSGDPRSWQGPVMLALWTLFEAAQARTHLQIDGSGVTVRVPWLPVLRRTVPYASIRSAEAGTEAPAGRYRLDDGPAGWGVVGGRAPVLILALADGRRFVYSTREAETAAALVNGWLRRQRGAETTPC